MTYFSNSIFGIQLPGCVKSTCILEVKWWLIGVLFITLNLCHFVINDWKPFPALTQASEKRSNETYSYHCKGLRYYAAINNMDTS